MPKFIAQHAPHILGIDLFTEDYFSAIEWLLDDKIDRSTIRGFAPEAVASAKVDCEAFQQANANDLKAYQQFTGHSGGVGLWLTRNGHESGFFDKGLGDLGYRLKTAARLRGQDSYQGDDGWIYLS